MSPHAPIRLGCILCVGVLCSFAPGRASADETFTVPSFDAPVETVGDYETPPVLYASELLPAELLHGRVHRVQNRVTNDGLLNHYVIATDLGAVPAAGDAMARERIREAHVIAQIQEIKKSDQYVSGFKAAATSPLRAARALIQDPVATLSAVPEGAKRKAQNVTHTVHGGRGETEDSFAHEIVGFSEIKREYAAAFDVDPYTSNALLQQELNDLAWASFAGGLPVRVALSFVPNPVGYAVSAIELSAELRAMLQDRSPASLRRINRERLAHMDVAGIDADGLLRNPKYSPRHETILIDALYRMRDVENRRAYIALAATARSARDAFLWQRTAELLAAYHARRAPLRRLATERGSPIAYRGDGVVVVALAADYWVWTQETAELAAAIRDEAERRETPARVEIWTSGRFTPRAQREFAALGFQTHERAFETLMGCDIATRIAGP